MSSSDLPLEIMEEILVRCCLTSLIRFTCVSKYWRSTITSPRFISRHTNYAVIQKKTTGDQLLLMWKPLLPDYPSTNKNLFVVRHNNLCVNSHKFELNIDTSASNTRVDEFLPCVIDVSKGMVCLCDGLRPHRSELFIMCNPAIRKYVTLPPPSVTPKIRGRHRIAMGFSFDDKADDYKLVRIVNSPPIVVEIYQLKTNAWRVIDSSPAHCPNFSENPFLNGAIHWITKKDITNEQIDEESYEEYNYIVVFDVSNEVFKEMNLPTGLDNESWTDMSLLVLGGLLCVEHKNYRGGGTCDIWAMREYGVCKSWTKQFSLKQQQISVIGMTKDEKRLLAYLKGDLIEYDLELQTTTSVIPREPSFHHFCADYVETLTLLNGLHGI